MNIFHKLGLVIIGCWLSLNLQAANLDYQLQPRKIATDTYVLIGKTEDFTLRNGGNIINTGFIITSAGVLVIDTGPSLLYGEQLRAAIANITDKPIAKVLHTNSHPDRFLGNQAFEDVPLAALPKTIADIRLEADMLTDNMYRMVGRWMRGTEPLIPTEEVQTGTFTLGDHQFELTALHGHTHADLVIKDTNTGVIFAGGLAFFNRMPTTPHANLQDWLNALDQLDKMDFSLMVPSHGEVVSDHAAIQQTRAYVQWLEQTLNHAAQQGLAMAEVMQTPLPEAFVNWGVGHQEFTRSVTHLYPALEAASLMRLN